MQVSPSQLVDRVSELLTPIRLFLLLCGVSLFVMLGGTCTMLSTGDTLPPPRPPPPKVETSAVFSYRYKEGFYRALLKEDAQKIKIKAPTLEEILKGNRHAAEFSGNQALKPGARLETKHLLLEAASKKVWVGEAGGGFRTEHLVLMITNKTERHLAYRVVTSPSGQCEGTGTITHNAVALRPQEKITRAECVTTVGVRVQQIEVLEITGLGYYYVSRLDPSQLKYDARTSEGHEIPAGLAPCRVLPWRQIDQGMQKGELRWFDVLDFYARHNCDEYSFFPEYRWSEKGPGSLPVRPKTEG